MKDKLKRQTMMYCDSFCLSLKTYLFSFSIPTLVPTPFHHSIPCTMTISKGSAWEVDFPQLFWDPYTFTLPKYSLKSLEDWTYTLYPTDGICHGYSELKLSWIKLQQVLYKYLEIYEKAPILFLLIREFWPGNFPVQKPYHQLSLLVSISQKPQLSIFVSNCKLCLTYWIEALWPSFKYKTPNRKYECSSLFTVLPSCHRWIIILKLYFQSLFLWLCSSNILGS